MKKKIKLKNSVKSSTSLNRVGAASASESGVAGRELTIANRSYKLKCYPTFSKSEIARYAIVKFNSYLNEEINNIYKDGKSKPTSGKGKLYNKAQYVAKSLLSKTKKASRVLKTKYSVPDVKKLFTRARIEKSKKSSFDYFVLVENLFEKSKVVRLPVKSHKALNGALKDDWEISEWCDLHYNETKKEFYVQVFLEKTVEKAKETKRFIGVDIGLNHAYVSSDGFKSPGLKSIRRKMNQKIADRQRYKVKTKKVKTHLKQKLDRYAKEIVNRVHGSELGLSFEAQKVIGRLSRGRLQGWAGAYLASRTKVLAKELSVYVQDVSPRYTSQICLTCGYKSKANRVGVFFCCKHCGYKNHADFVASVNLARRASGERKLNPATLMVHLEHKAKRL